MTNQQQMPWNPEDPAFPWEAGQGTTMPAFLDTYTLHDSQLTGISFETYGVHVGDAFAQVLWDIVWIGEQFAAAGTPLERDPTLFFRFPAAYRVEGVQRDPLAQGNTIATATSRELSQTEREAMAATLTDAVMAYLAPAHLHLTTFTTIYGGEVRFIHGRDIRVLCATGNGLIPIPGI